MATRTPIFRSVGFSLLKHAFAAYVVVAVVVTGYQAWDEYQLTTEQNIDHLRDSQLLVEDAIANAVWHLDKPLLSDLLNGILSRKEVIGIRVRDHENQLITEIGVLQSTLVPEFVHQFVLSDPTGLSQQIIGHVEIHSSREIILQKLKPTLQVLVMAAIVKTIALWIIFIYFGKRLLGMPLNRLAHIISTHRTDELVSRLKPEEMNEIEKLSVEILNMHESSERLLTRSEQRLQQILDAAGEGILVLDDKGTINYSNPQACQILGWSRDEMLGADPQQLLGNTTPTDDHASSQCEIKKVLTTAECIDREDTHFNRKDGSKFPAALHGSPLIDDNKVTGAVVIFQDISARKKNEQMLRNSRNTYQTTLDNLPEQVSYKNQELVYVSANRSFADQVHTPSNEIPGKRTFDLFPESMARQIDIVDEAVLKTGQSIKFEEEHEQDGEKHYSQTMTSPVFNQKKHIVGVLSITWDITQIKQAEKARQMMEVQLNHAQKLESVGQLAAGIAHEINTPVQFVSDNTHFLKGAFEDINTLVTGYQNLFASIHQTPGMDNLQQQIQSLEDDTDLSYLREEIPNAIDQSQGGLQRISKIVLAMKEFSHPGTDEKTPTDLNHSIQSTIDVSRNEWKYNSELSTELDPYLPMVPVLPGEFNQVILNMITNAAHAIKTAHGDEKKGEIKIQTLQQDKQVEIRISDNGSGMPDDVKKRIFDPFFTTKEVGKGTGQGLAIAYSAIVDKHGGAIEVETEEKAGTTFIIRLPIEPKENK